MSEQNIVDRADLRKWRIELPNLYDDSDLDPYEFRLLAHYKRVGTCTESTATTGAKCKMSAGKVSTTRKSLASKGLITLVVVKFRGGNAFSIEVVDVWESNFQKYSTSQKDKTPSLSEPTPSLSEPTPSPHETKKEPIKNKPIKKATPSLTASHLTIQAIREITNRYPNSTIQQALIDKVGAMSLDKLKPAYEAWTMKGYNPTNYDGWVGWAVNGIPTNTRQQFNKPTQDPNHRRRPKPQVLP